jgi:hypothetical protein
LTTLVTSPIALPPALVPKITVRGATVGERLTLAAGGAVGALAISAVE